MAALNPASAAGIQKTQTFTNLSNGSWFNLSELTTIESGSVNFTSLSVGNASGGTIIESGGYYIHFFNSSGTFVSNNITSVEVLVVGGGGSGSIGKTATYLGEGGGAGDVKSNPSYTVSGSIAVTVGDGGAKLTSGQINMDGNPGQASSFGTITANGGVGGLYNTGTGGTSGSGFTGGAPNGARGGGGAGAGENGKNANASNGGDGGSGNTSSITGTSMCYGGGGGGTNGGNGGCGGGGSSTVSGTPNTGGGGGGGDYGASDSGAGGSGVVIIRYPKPNTTVYVQPQGHPTSETKTSNTSSIFINLSITPGVQMQNFQAFSNKTGTFNLTLIYNATYILQLTSPANTSTGITTPTTLTWKEWPNLGLSHNFYVSTDYQFINLISSGTSTPTDEIYTTSVSLAAGTKYYWRVKNATGAYSNIFEFTTASPAITPGRLNVTVFDEQNWPQRISTFSVQLYNLTAVINKTTSTGWVNFSETEVISGEYLVRIVPNSSYAPRNVLAQSPGNVTVYLPSTGNTINTVAFYLLDYLGIFPWQTSKLYIWKNNSVMHSSYFDADAKVAAYLIQGDAYKITVINGNNMQEWGNYIPTSSGNVEITLNQVGINYTSYQPFSHNITWSSSNITLRWASPVGGTLTSLNFSIYKGADRQQVHQLITSVPSGMSEYIVTNTSDIYYVVMTYTLSTGTFSYTKIINYNIGKRESTTAKGFRWTYGKFQTPEWVYNIFAIFILLVLGAGFGAVHSPLGSIITGIFAVVFMAVGWLTGTTAGIGFISALVIYLGLYYIQEKEKKP